MWPVLGIEIDTNEAADGIHQTVGGKIDNKNKDDVSKSNVTFLQI